MANSATFVTPEAILSYVTIFEPKQYKGEGEAKYSCVLIFKKNQDLSSIKNAFNGVLQDAFDGRLPYGATPVTGSPLVDGAIRYPDDPFYADKWILNTSAKADHPPKIIDQYNRPITNRSEVYSGCIGQAAIHFYSFAGGKSGISCSLVAIKKIADGDPLSSSHVDVHALFGAPVAAPDEHFAPPVATPTAPPVAPAAPPAAVAPAHVMTPKAAGMPYEAFIAAGWTAAQLIANGYMNS